MSKTNLKNLNYDQLVILLSKISFEEDILESYLKTLEEDTKDYNLYKLKLDVAIIRRKKLVKYMQNKNKKDCIIEWW